MSGHKDEGLKQELEHFYSTSRTYMERLRKHDKRSFAEYIALCRRVIPEGSTVLDCGCGVGLSSYLLAQDGFEVTATDISPLFISEAKKIYGDEPQVTYSVEDVCDMSFPDASFDTACSFDLIEHVFDVHRALREMCRVAKGEVLIFQANHLDFIRHLEKALHWEPKNRYKPWEGRSRTRCIYRFLRNGLVTLAKAIGINHKIYYVEPVLCDDEDACGEDFDATWLTNRYDIENVLKKNGFSVVDRFYLEFEDGVIRRLKRLGLNGKTSSYYMKMRAACIIYGRRDKNTREQRASG